MSSRFDKDTIREYFEFCQRAGLKRISSISGITDHAHKTGNNDAEIKVWLFPDDDSPQIVCPTCEGRGRIPEPQPSAPEVCRWCGGRGETYVFNFATQEDELVPCKCAKRGRSLTTEEQEAQRAIEEERERKGRQALSKMLGVSEIAIPFPSLKR